MAGTVTCNGLPVVEARLSLPRIGVWSGALVVETEATITGDVELVAGGVTYRGTARHSGKVAAACNVFVVGGKDGCQKFARPKFYTSPTLRIILGDLLRDAGETLDSTADSAVLASKIPAWTTMAQPTGEAIATLLRRATSGALWRVLPGGGVWVGSESWPSCSVSYALLEDMPEEGQWQIGLDSPEVLPGQMIDGRRVDRVEYSIKGDRVRATAWVLP